MEDNTTSLPLAETSQQSSHDYYYNYDYFGFGDPDVYLPVLYAMLCVSGGIGSVANTFALIVITTSSFGKKLSLLFIMHQSLCDLVSSISMLVTFISNWSQAFGHFYCYVIWSEAWIYMGFYASAFNTMSLTAERYLMIVFPLQHRLHFTKTKAVVGMALMWLVAFILNIPGVTAVYVVEGQCYVNYFMKSPQAQQIYSYILVVVTFFIPIIFIAFSYGHMLFVIHQKKKVQIHPGSVNPVSTTSTTKLSKVQMNIFHTLIIVTVLFTVTWIPNQLYYLLYSISIPLNFADPLYNLSLVLVQINACVNPFIYIYKFKDFHTNAVRLLKCQSRSQVGPTVSVLSTDRSPVSSSMNTVPVRNTNV